MTRSTLDRLAGIIRWTVWVLVCCAVLPFGTAEAQVDCTAFVAEVIDDRGTNGVESVAVGDLDGDGDIDVVTASNVDGKILWHENDGNTPPGFVTRTIVDAAVGVAQVIIVDLDGDGKNDVLSATRDRNLIAWHQNRGGTPPLFLNRTVAARAQVALGVAVGDINDDGHLDVLSASFGDDTLAWHEAASDFTSFAEHIITSSEDGAAAIAAADVDGDGDTDIVGSARIGNRLVWYEVDPDPMDLNGDGETAVLTEHLIDGALDGADTIATGDLDGDLYADIVVVAIRAGTVTWYEVTPDPGDADMDGELFEVVATPIDALSISPTGVAIADLNGDARMDIVTASFGDDTVAWFQNDGQDPPGFDRQPAISVSARSVDSVAVGDINNDGTADDVLAAGSVPGFPARFDRTSWFENDGGASPSFISERLIVGSADGAESATLADVDGDGDMDVVTAGREDKIAWYESDGGMPAPTYTQHVVSTAARGAVYAAGADLDGDGDTDLFSASSIDGKIAWYENDGAMNPATPSFTERVVTTGLAGAIEVLAADVDGDMELDLVAVGSDADTVAWYRNDGQDPPTFVETLIDTAADGVRSIAVADIENPGDGDLDLFVASADGNEIAWYENDGAMPPVFTKRTIDDDAGGASDISLADLDADGDLDGLSVSGVEEIISWHENIGGTPVQFTNRIIDLGLANALAIEAFDVDGDGDLDPIVALPDDNAILWYANDGAVAPAVPTFEAMIAVEPFEALRSIYLGDVDGDIDGAIDLVTGGALSVDWFRVSGEICDAFDATGDGRIDGLELTWVGRSFGEFSATPNVEWWFKVDFNQDGIVDGEDLAILSTPGVWGQSTTSCRFVCR